MVKGRDVLEMLIPTGSWVITENDYDSIQWLDCEPLLRQSLKQGLHNTMLGKQNKMQQKQQLKQHFLLVLELPQKKHNYSLEETNGNRKNRRNASP